MRVSRAQRERMASYAKILKHHGIFLTDEELYNTDIAILHRPEDMGELEIIDKIIEKHKKRTVKRNRLRVNKLTKHSKRVVKTYASLSLCAIEEFGDIKTKAAISNVCNGRAKSYKGWCFSYVD
jgi:hypothetical protein